MSSAKIHVQTPAPPLLHTGCGGDCHQGRRSCTCGGPIIGMWDDEREAAWLLTTFAIATVLALVASALWPWGFAT